MDATDLLKKSPYMKKWMTQANPPKEASTVKTMNGRSLIFSSKNEHTTLKNGRLQVVF